MAELILEPHAKKSIKKFATILDISQERAAYIEFMRKHYLAWEYDYIKIPNKEKE